MGDDWPSAAILAATQPQVRGEETESPTDTTILRDSPPPAVGSVFPSYWPEHELSFSEPSSPASISSEEEREGKKAKKKQKKKKKTSKELTTEKEEQKKEAPKPIKKTKPDLTIDLPRPIRPNITSRIRPEGGVVLPNGDVVTRLAASQSEGWLITSAEPVGPGQNLDFCRGAVFVSFRRGMEECATHIPYDFKYEMQYSTNPRPYFN